MKRTDKIYEWLNKKIGIQNGFLILLFVILMAYSYNKVIDRNNKPAYTKGISLGVKKESRGTRMIKYEFKVDGKFFNGHVPEGFCKNGNKIFCDSGAIVFVKYQYDNPDNNTLVQKIPE